jgi:arylsulfatase A-like enzyme
MEMRNVTPVSKERRDLTAPRAEQGAKSGTQWRSLFAFGALVAALGGPACQPRETPAGLPNIVLILADDLGYGDPGSYNSDSRIPTPALDRLAAEGMRFTDAHAPASVCTPTRYAILTGRYAWRTSLKSGVFFGYDPLLIDTTRLTLASLLKKHGYMTGAIGKWHLGLGTDAPTDYFRPLRPGPNALGFDYFFGIPASLDMTPYVFVRNTSVVEVPSDSVGPSAMRRDGGGGFWRAGPAAPGFRHQDVLPRIAEEAVDFVDRYGDEAQGRPFFLYVALTAPHTPWLPGESFQGSSKAGPYGDFVAQVDDVVSQVQEVLASRGLDKRTLVIFTSDNGAHWLPRDIERYGHRANGHWRGQKADIHEGGHRIPFIVRWPGVVAGGSATDVPVVLTDLMATFAAIAGESLPDGAGEDSWDLLPVLREEAVPEWTLRGLVHHSLDGMFAIRQGPWKLVEGLGSGGFTQPSRVAPEPRQPAGQLYHLSEDPAESSNQYARRPEVVRRLQDLLERYRTEGRSRPRTG